MSHDTGVTGVTLGMNPGMNPALYELSGLKLKTASATPLPKLAAAAIPASHRTASFALSPMLKRGRRQAGEAKTVRGKNRARQTACEADQSRAKFCRDTSKLLIG